MGVDDASDVGSRLVDRAMERELGRGRVGAGHRPVRPNVDDVLAAQAADDIAWRNVADTVFRRPAADLALYEAKRAGRNTWRWSGLS